MQIEESKDKCKIQNLLFELMTIFHLHLQSLLHYYCTYKYNSKISQLTTFGFLNLFTNLVIPRNEQYFGVQCARNEPLRWD